MVQMEDNIRPPFLPQDALDILAAHYDRRAPAAKPLPSELDRNYHLQTEDRRGCVLKIAHPSVSDRVLDLQNAALKHLAPALSEVPRLIRAKDGSEIIHIQDRAGKSYRARLLTYLPGIPLCDFRPHSPELLQQLGAKLGEMTARLTRFDHPEKRADYRWNIRNLPQILPYAADLPADRKAVLAHFAAHYQAQVAPALPTLRHSFVHNDLNDTNILIRLQSDKSAQVAGIIDFGDMVCSPTLTDLAVALAYVMMHSPRPLESAAAVIRGFHSRFALTETEIRLLFPLTAARLCLSVCISWHQQKQEPDNPHLSISEAGAWDLLHRLRGIHPRFAHYRFRAACGLPACPHSAPLQQWLAKQTFAPILGFPLTQANSAPLDFGMTSRLLSKVSDLCSPADYAAPLQQQLGGGKIGIGLYSEVRPIYRRALFAVTPHERRSVHLGIDLFAPAGTPIYAPLDGIIHSLQDHRGEQDYGPTLILRHQAAEQEKPFFTLYGHLSPAALTRWQVGQSVSAGELLAHIGNYPRNGNWPPHLHFQIVLDLLDDDHFPGVCTPRLRTLFTSLSPNPNLILRLPFQAQPPQRQSPAALLTKRQQHLNPALSLSYQEPLKIERAYLHHLYDDEGQPYLDCVNNVAHIGHNHPRTVAAAQAQMAILNTNTRYLHDAIVEYAAALSATLPEPLSVCFFVNSGSEANELALRLARTYTAARDCIVIDHAYHGHTSALIELSPYKFNGRGGSGKAPHIEVAAMPDGYRGRDGFGRAAGKHYARSIAAALENIRARGKKPAAFFAEGILGCGGQMPLPAGYLADAYALVRQAGGLCVADEVQTGFGRAGSHFWSFELSGVIPDIVTMGKPIANGHPLGAVVTTPAIAAAFNNGMEYFNTFGGNPVSCAIGLEVLRVIADEQLQHNALAVGSYWMDCLRQLQAQFPLIGQVRGAGLFIGIELVRSRTTLEAAASEADAVAEAMKKRGILISTEGPRHNVLKLKPPIIFARRHVDFFISTLADILQHTALQPN